MSETGPSPELTKEKELRNAEIIHRAREDAAKYMEEAAQKLSQNPKLSLMLPEEADLLSSKILRPIVTQAMSDLNIIEDVEYYLYKFTFNMVINPEVRKRPKNKKEIN